MKRILSVVLIVAMILCIFAGCGKISEAAINLSADIATNPVKTEVTPDGATAATDFAVRLFKESRTAGENTLISPFSVFYALAMTANGAEGETKAQMEKVMGVQYPGAERISVQLQEFSSRS